ncbi:MAG: LacI family DNA-binding transcriptional regulator [Anaerolineae bacterium]|jgi:LacI family transcriptional regulator, repressor for deo operon, udp, cdd, tsx, nupC, and nupG|nr:LacI family DNA-binding transcriptional regulator [Anaerolineae bacterium]MBT7781920.1 LacI family DNA-binding transcriptional regulator [Anaerolineae bacterium]
MKRSKNLPTSNDVAKLAGVSQSTVSLVLAGKAERRVSAEVQEKVREATRVLGYRPHAAARTLRLGRAKAIALLLPDVVNPYFAAVLRGADRAARQQDYALLFVDTENDQNWLEMVIGTLAAGSVDGFVLFGVEPPEQSELGGFEPRIVVVDAPSSIFPLIAIDGMGGTLEAMNHLLSLGHRRIAYLGVSSSKETFRVRTRAYHQALNNAGINLGPDYEKSCLMDIDDAKVKAREILSLPDRPTAIFCADERLAVGVYKVAKDMGLRIPIDLSVVGFGGTQIAHILEPELTTVNVPSESLGNLAVSSLIECLETNVEPKSRIESVDFIIRGSTTTLIQD